MEKKGSYWILTACHNLLNKSDGEKLKEGNFQRIEHLEEKMKENLLFTSFVLPDEQLKLTNEKDVVDVVGDISHVPLIYDPVRKCDSCTYVCTCDVICVSACVCQLYILHNLVQNVV